MAEKGFSIRCPHCFEWSDWADLDPDTVAVQSDDEWEEILCDLKERPEEFSHRKMLTCQNSIGDCPAPFQAFICKNARSAHRYVESTPSWALERAFRLYRTNHVDRRDRTAIIFCTRSVPRQKHIELEKVLDRELLSRVIVGMGLEMNGPVTVYTGMVFEPGGMGSTHWVPVEAYTADGPGVPPRYNPFCRICRRAGMDSLLNRFEGKATTANCLKKPVPYAKDGMCAGRKAACKAGDWSHCPAFLDARRGLRMCYCYDEMLIKTLEENWRKRKLPEPPHETHTCWAGFCEIAVPIVVHEHFVGVAMTGQFVLEDSDPQSQRSVDTLIECFEPLKQSGQSTRAKLTSLAEVLFGRREPANDNDEEQYARTFRLTQGQFQEKMRRLARNAERIATAASAGYRHFRARSETVFKHELLGRVEKAEDLDGSFGEDLLVNVLERMRRFWAFQRVYLLNWLPQSNRLSVVAFSRKGRKPKFFGMPGKLLGLVEESLAPTHPLPWLYDRHMKGHPQEAWLERLWSVFEEVWDDEELDVPDGRYYFVVSVPFADQTLSFIFAVRDEREVSALRHLEKGGISPLCQDTILGTCADFFYRFGKIWYHHLREKAWREFSALASHRIGNEIHAVGTLLDVLADELRAERRWAENWGEDLTIMHGCVKSAKKMLNDLTTLTGEVRPQRRPVWVDEIIRRAVRGVLSPDGKLEMLGFDDAPEVAVDPDLMEQVFRELVTNAVRVAGENVTLTVRATELPAAGRKADHGEGGRYLEIWFSDNGPGIPPEQRERIFQPFTTPGRSRASLGLTVVRRIIEAHAGAISLVHAEIGTTFLIRIPLSGDAL